MGPHEAEGPKARGRPARAEQHTDRAPSPSPTVARKIPRLQHPHMHTRSRNNNLVCRALRCTTATRPGSGRRLNAHHGGKDGGRDGSCRTDPVLSAVVPRVMPTERSVADDGGPYYERETSRSATLSGQAGQRLSPWRREANYTCTDANRPLGPADKSAAKVSYATVCAELHDCPPQSWPHDQRMSVNLLAEKRNQGHQTMGLGRMSGGRASFVPRSTRRVSVGASSTMQTSNRLSHCWTPRGDSRKQDNNAAYI